MGWIFSLFLCVTLIKAQELKDVTPCDNRIFCYGPLLHDVQLAELYPDSKTFVDMTLKQSQEAVLEAFEDLPNNEKATMQDFVDTYFDGPNLEFDTFEPTDWKESPLFLEKINDYTYKEWARSLHKLWFTLGRKIKTDVNTNSDLYSMIYVDDHFIVPGGRFREFYYWDTYWIIKGLLLSEMYDTVRGMIRNWGTLIKRYGKILNGNRVYFENRSQPPFLIPTVLEYYQTTKDREFLAEMLPLMEEEYAFWMNNRTVEFLDEDTQKNYTLNQYNVYMGHPRPESYREDLETAGSLGEDDAAQLFADIASAAESGWDFSSRWLGPGESPTLDSIRTTKIVPADLNSIMCKSERAMMMFYTEMGNFEKVGEYSAALNARMEAVQQILWNEEEGVWLDYDLDTKTGRKEFAVSNISPLWARCFVEDPDGGVTDFESKSLAYLQGMKVLEFPGGIPATLIESGQQWDFPNVWPPMMEMAIQAIDGINSDEAKKIAFDLATNWTSTNWNKYAESDVMYEKYNCYDGTPGSGGEYEIQDGFGWTNGVILTLLDKYGEDLVNPNSGSSISLTGSSQACVLLFSLLSVVYL